MIDISINFSGMGWLAVAVIFLALLGSFFCYLIGLMTLISFTLPLKPPADKSNRINRIRLWWFAVASPHRSVASFYWLRNDEIDSLGGNTWDDFNKRG